MDEDQQVQNESVPAESVAEHDAGGENYVEELFADDEGYDDTAGFVEPSNESVTPEASPAPATPEGTEGTAQPNEELKSAESVAPEAPAAAEPAVPETPSQPAAPGIDPVEFETQITQRLVQSYQLTDEEREAWEQDPVAALPTLAATLHKRVMSETLAIVQAALPAQIERYQEVTRREAEAKEAFYGRWPELKPYHAQVMQAGEMYSKLANAKATKQERIEAIGRMVVTALGLPSVQAPAPAPAPAPVAPATPAPYQPAGGGAPAVGGFTAPANVFSDLVDPSLDF